MSWILYPLKGIINYGLGGMGASAIAATLPEAIRDRLVAEAAMSGLGGRIYNRNAPPRSRTTFPFAVISIINEDFMPTSGPTFPVMTTVQVAIFHSSDTVGQSIRDAAYKLFGPDQPCLSFQDGSTTLPIQGRKWEWAQPRPLTGSNLIWGFAFQMDLLVTRRVIP